MLVLGDRAVRQLPPDLLTAARAILAATLDHPPQEVAAQLADVADWPRTSELLRQHR